MLPFLKTKKSAGVPVTSGVHRVITRANDARDREEWDIAAENFRAAVQEDPSLVHIWIQLGHAEKERGRLGNAEAAYARAALLQPDEAEPLLHLGHVYKLLGNVSGAVRSYLQAARRDAADAQAIEELQSFIGRTAPFGRPDMISLLRDAAFEQKEEDDLTQDRARAAGSEALLFDVSSLVAAALSGRSFADSGLVGDKIIPAVIRESGRRSLMCAHVIGHSRWVAVSQSQFARILALGRSSHPIGSVERQDAVTDLDLAFLLSSPLEMPNGALLINVDADNSPADHALFIQYARTQFEIRYLAFGSTGDATPAERAQLSPQVVLAALAKPVAAELPASSSHARIARFEKLGNGGGGWKSRTGTGWLPAEDWGCWAAMPGGDLEIALPDLDTPRLYLRLKALPAEVTRYQIVMQDGRQVSGEIDPGLQKWVVIDNVPVDEGILRLRIRGEDGALVNVQGVNRKLPAMVGVAGFFVCEQKDRAARTALLETTTLGELESLY